MKEDISKEATKCKTEKDVDKRVTTTFSHELIHEVNEKDRHD
jgi:hypothetical protein